MRELVWGNWGYSGSLGSIEDKEEDGARGRVWSQGAEGERKDGAGDSVWDKETKKEEPEALRSHFIFLYHLFASVNLKICFAERQF